MNFITVLGVFMSLCFHSSFGQKGLPPSKPSYSKDLETALRTELFNSSNYHVLQRPQKKIIVDVSLTLLTINELNIKDQFLSISGYLSLKWLDSRLAWYNPSTTSQDYSNVPFLFSSETYVWRPAIIVENAIDDMSVISDPNIPMRINNRGIVTWNPAGIYKVSCDSDIKYYPLDKQICTIVISAWAYTSHEIVLIFDSPPIDLDFYSENGEWELVETHGDKAGERSRGGQTFSNLQFTLTLRRRPLFHILSTLFPVLLMAVLISMVFQLPPESGEKIGFSLTVLLAYAVYLTLISETIPSTSVTACYLSIYLAMILALGTISVICTILVLKVNFKKSSTDIPHLLDVLVWKFIVKIICWKHHCCCCKTKVGSSSSNEVKLFTVVNEKHHQLPSDGKSSVMEDTQPTADVDDVCVEEHTWQEMALILDNFFFVIFISVILIASFIYCLIILIQYINIVT